MILKIFVNTWNSKKSIYLPNDILFDLSKDIYTNWSQFYRIDAKSILFVYIFFSR